MNRIILELPAPYVGLRRTPLTIDKLFALYDTITPEDMRAMAAKYFVGADGLLSQLCDVL